ncbi:MAG: 5-(carboxyamino)imidazole ribonucleotide mutase [Bdellovibrionales bacterium]|nr:5-(carboxyamino)imidazole ribonucleotide mutase [Bdellovibrionales bacterium]
MKVNIVMGSKSDFKVMSEAKDALDQFGIECDLKVISAHRTPQKMLDFAKNQDADVIIAGAGGAAHLPGMIASQTVTPVIGVPINVTSLNGMDSLLSIVQMPKGVPVATVAIDQAFNAGLLAVQILSVKDKTLKAKLSDYKMELQKLVEQMNESIK